MTVVPIFCAWASSHSKTRQDCEHKGQSWQTAVLTRPVLPLWREQSVCADLQLGWGSDIQPSGRQDPASSALCLGCLSRCLVAELCQDRPCFVRTVVHLRRAWVESSTWNQASPGPLGTDRWLAFSRSSRFSVNHELWSQNLEVFFRFYWRIVELPCCANFCYTAKWLSYTYIYIYIYIYTLLYFFPLWFIEYKLNMLILNIVPCVVQ